jgi:hypothetical protein
MNAGGRAPPNHRGFIIAGRARTFSARDNIQAYVAFMSRGAAGSIWEYPENKGNKLQHGAIRRDMNRARRSIRRRRARNGPIKQGATPVTEAGDIVSVLQPIMGVAVSKPDRDAGETTRYADPASDERTRIVALLSPIPVAIDPPLAIAAPNRAHGAVGAGHCRTA